MPEEVTLKQEIFCQSWVDTVGNGTRSALIAFDIENKEVIDEDDQPKPLDKSLIKKWEEEIKLLKKEKKRIFNVAGAMATECLRKPNIIKRIDEILEERGFNDDAVKREHFKLLSNSKDEVKIRAIDSYYKLKGKITDKVDHTTNGDKITGFNYILPNNINGNTENNNTDNTATSETTSSLGEVIGQDN